MRTCVICRVVAPKKELQRLSLSTDFGGNENQGRGAYVCAEHNSAQILKNKKKLAKALRCDVEALHIHLKGEIRS